MANKKEIPVVDRKKALEILKANVRKKWRK